MNQETKRIQRNPLSLKFTWDLCQSKSPFFIHFMSVKKPVEKITGFLSFHNLLIDQSFISS